jgi:hypothetical protein
MAAVKTYRRFSIMDNPAEILFTTGSDDMTVRYQGPDGGRSGCPASFNGFELYSMAPPPPDTNAATPGPMTWATVPYATGPYSISMTATTASDPGGVKYNFTCTAGGGHDSNWQQNPTYPAR